MEEERHVSWDVGAKTSKGRKVVLPFASAGRQRSTGAPPPLPFLLYLLLFYPPLSSHLWTQVGQLRPPQAAETIM